MCLVDQGVDVMYRYEWDPETGGIILSSLPHEGPDTEDLSPVFSEELDWLGLDKHWTYQHTKHPLMWKVDGRKYFYRGELAAELSSSGGLFMTPAVKIHRPGLTLQPIDMDGTIERNRATMDGLTLTAIEEIGKQSARLSPRVDVQAVAFSGGKDSVVLLDLVQRAIDPDRFLVVFSDTHMEVSETLSTLEAAKKHWPSLAFHVAKSSRTALDTWRDMGPPSRMHRWCCTVHKSAPSLILLRETTGIRDAHVLVYDGVRASESQRRGSYLMVSEGRKHTSQINVSPVLRWSSAEIYLYLFARCLPLNEAYRYGAMRVGCVVCPMAPRRWDSLVTARFLDRAAGFIELLKSYARGIGIPESEMSAYLAQGGWKGRSGGRGVETARTRIAENRSSNATSFSISLPRESWREWFKTLGVLQQESAYDFSVCLPTGDSLLTHVTETSSHLKLELDGLDALPREARPLVKAAINKSAYCAHCRGCEVECSAAALSTYPTVHVDEESCVHCGKCLKISDRGCLAAKSLWITLGGARVNSNRKSINPYNHFGMRKEWLEDYFRDPSTWPERHTLGPRQADSMTVWLNHCGIEASKSLSPLGAILQRLGAESEVAWCAIWANLAQNSGIVEWYVRSVPWGSVHNKADFVEMLGESWSVSTRNNAITALTGLLANTPLGNQLELGVISSDRSTRTKSVFKKGLSSPHAIAVLYSLYLYAEASDVYRTTIAQLETACGGPATIFGLDRPALASILNGLSAECSDFISAGITRNLDNIHLRRDRTSIEVLTLALD